ncbi:pirin family protein [Paraburkholderia acidisoli]|uniref:Pirin family protein n=1 Tax=Paraburkholderia acidisoli TaxID=2571748 RepID=A0A7Z2GRL6_9BURK|nr:pirin family protein [Paraburkholderia acidisoli]QGZ66688.1 pirin family protein [Paraburkholderia acidisoli]
MIEHRPFDALGTLERAWLQTRLHCRYGELGCPDHAPQRALLVWNDDVIAPHSGFGLHAHRNVEILTVVLRGAITHEDSAGHRGRIAAGSVQAMSAGRGIRHAERNEEGVATQLFQIWLRPRALDGEPRWATRGFELAQDDERCVVLASARRDEIEAGALPIDAPARLLAAVLREGVTLTHALAADTDAYLVPATGRIDVNGVRLAPRDGAALRGEHEIRMTARDATVVVIVELPLSP